MDINRGKKRRSLAISKSGSVPTTRPSPKRRLSPGSAFPEQMPDVSPLTETDGDAVTESDILPDTSTEQELQIAPIMQRISIFCSYSHEDRELMEGLKKHLVLLEQRGILTIWYDREINPGSRWEDEINNRLDTATIILLMISPDFMNSKYCFGKEMIRAMERHERGEALVIPVILRPVDWHGAPFGKLQALPTDGKPVLSRHWKYPDEGFEDITKGILKTIERIELLPEPDGPITEPDSALPKLHLNVVSRRDFIGPVLGTSAILTGVILSVLWHSSALLLALAFVSLLLVALSARKWLHIEQLSPVGLWQSGFAGRIICLIALVNLVLFSVAGLAGISLLRPLPSSTHPSFSPSPAPTPPPGKLLYYKEVFSGYWINDVAWSRDGNYLATANGDGSVWVLNASNGSEFRVYQNDGCKRSCWFNAVAWSPDSEHVAAASGDGTVQVWDIATGVHLTYRNPTGGVWTLAWSPDGTRIASAGRDGTVQIWDATSGHLISAYHGHTKGVWAIAWSPDGNAIASGGVDRTVQVWDVNDGHLIYTYHGHLGAVFSIAWSPDGTRIASASGDATVQAWNARNGSDVVTYSGHSSSVQAVDWSRDGKWIVSASNDTTVQIWDASTGTHVYTYSGHHNGVYGVAWSPDSKYIASAGDDGTVQVWWAF